MGIRSCIFMLCTWVGIAASAQAAPQYRFEPLPVREGLQLWRIGGFNNAGQVAAVWSDRAQPILYEAALYTPGLGHAAIGPRSAGGIGLNGMNASGEVVGSVGHWDALRAWRFTPEATPFGGLAAGVNGLATGVNDAGVVVGSAASRPWIVRAGGAPEALDLGGIGLPSDINNRGEVLVGSGPGGPAVQMYRHDLASGTTTQVRTPHDEHFTTAILNDLGDVAVTAGTKFPSAGVVHADGSFSALAGLPGHSNQLARDLNNRGQVLGASFTAGPDTPFDMAPFVYTPGEGTANPFATTAVPDGWTDLSLTALNDHGDLVGIGWFQGQSQLFVLDAVAAPVPEPASMLLLMAGAGVLATRVRPRSRP